MRVFDGIKVLDLSRLAPGPFCTMLLGDFGADVLMVEAPGQFVSTTSANADVSSDPVAARRRQVFDPRRRNKRSIVINLREPEGRDLFYRLCADADVVVEGFRPGVVGRLGVDYVAASRINPRIVYLSLSGYGQSGPYQQMVGHDINYISIAGALGSIGRPGQPPAIPQNYLADYAGGGLMAAFAIASALLVRERTGRGQCIDLAMTDGLLYLQAAAIGTMLGGEVPPPGPGRGEFSGADPSYEVYETADGRWISIGARETRFWNNLCDVIGREDLKPRQHDAGSQAEIREAIARTFKCKTRDEWFKELRTTELCIAPVYTLDEALADEHNRARAMVVELPDPAVGTVRQVGIGPKFSATPGEVRTVSPVAGQHTDEVLGALGYDARTIAALRERGVVS